MNKWPHLDYLSWRETCSALHLYLQIAGKYRLAHTPWLNHSWNATFYVTPHGLASSPIPDGPGIEILFDLLEHKVVGTCGNGTRLSFDLGPMTVATFHASFVKLISELGGTPTFNGSPNEVPFPVRFAEDDRDRPYDREAVQRFHQVLIAVDRVFNRFRTSFLGKSSPVHLFWGALDLAVTRFSGRRAPLHPGGIPALPNDVAQEAYDREVSSAGFWPGGGGIDYPAFYAYAYPAPGGYRAASVQPDAAFWHGDLSEFVLPYDAVQSSADPDEALMAFLVSTYEAAADNGAWDRDLLECAQGQPRQVRPPDAGSASDSTSTSKGIVEREDGPSNGRYRLVLDGVEAEMTFGQEAGETTALEIDPRSYTGVWYEMARTPTPYQDCKGGVTATYNLIDDATMEVINRCDRASGDEQGVTGEAEVVDGNFNTFSVEFGDDSGAPGVNYVVAAVGDEVDGQYPWSAVYSPDGDTGWILAREPELSAEERQEAEAALSEMGVDLGQLSLTNQPPETYDPMAD